MPEEGILTGTYFTRDQVPDCPDFTRAKNKLLSWDKYFMPRHTLTNSHIFPHYAQISNFLKICEKTFTRVVMWIDTGGWEIKKILKISQIYFIKSIFKNIFRF